MKSVLNIAHRGASGHAPENTLVAFEQAVQMGADMIELDIRLSVDKQWVVIHDQSLKRTTGSRGSVGRFTLKALKKLDVGSWFGSRYRGEKIPTLREVLHRVGTRVRLNVEIKEAAIAYRTIGEGLLACLKDESRFDPPLISSFNESVLQKVRSLDASIPVGYLFQVGPPQRVIRRALKLAAVSVHGSTRVVSEELIAKAHAEGLKVYVYTIDEEEAMRRWIGLGVDGIFTNTPDRLATVLRKIWL